MGDRVRVKTYNEDEHGAPGVYRCPRCLGFCKCAGCCRKRAESARGDDSEAFPSPVAVRSPQGTLFVDDDEETEDEERSDDVLDLLEWEGDVVSVSVEDDPPQTRPDAPITKEDVDEWLAFDKSVVEDTPEKEVVPSTEIEEAPPRVEEEEETALSVAEEEDVVAEEEDTSAPMDEEEAPALTEETPPSTTPPFVPTNIPYCLGSAEYTRECYSQRLAQSAVQRRQELIESGSPNPHPELWDVCIPFAIRECRKNRAQDLVYKVEWTSLTNTPSDGMSTNETDAGIKRVFEQHCQHEPIDFPNAGELVRVFWWPVRTHYFEHRGSTAAFGLDDLQDNPTDNALAREAVNALVVRRASDMEAYRTGEMRVMRSLLGMKSILDTLTVQTEEIKKQTAANTARSEEVMAAMNEQLRPRFGGKSPRPYRTGKTLLSVSQLRDIVQEGSESKDEQEESEHQDEQEESEYQDESEEDGDEVD